MSEFDPYLKWLGIRDPDRPVHHYRLLALDLFEDDPEIIAMAADRQMSHVRTYQNGPHGDQSQKLLNELARARRCLLTAAQKQIYDDELRQQLADMKDAAIPAIDTLPIARGVTDQPPMIENATPTKTATAKIDVQSDSGIRQKRIRREKKHFLWSLFGWITGGLAALGVGAWLIGSGLLFSDDPETQSVGVGDNNSESTGPPASKPILATDVEHKDPSTVPDKTGQNIHPSDSAATNDESSEANVQNTTPDSNQAGTKPGNLRQKILKKLASYPTADAEAQQLILAAKTAVGKRKIHEFELSSDSGGDRVFREVPRQGGLLIGLATSVSEDGSITMVLPIYINQSAAFPGRAIGKQQRQLKTFIAKPGYAVGEIEVSRLAPMSCLRLTFMKIQPDRLDVTDRYQSVWIGNERDPVRRIGNPAGLPIIGVRGRYQSDAQVMAIGMIAPRITAVPAKSVADSQPEPNGQVSPKKPSGNDKTSFFPESVGTTTGKTTESPAAKTIPKPPPPSSRELREARKTVSTLYEKRRKTADTPLKVQRLAKLLLSDAKVSNDDASTKFVILNESIIIAIGIGDAKTAIEAVRELDSGFELDFWKLVKDVIDEAAINSNPVTAQDFRLTMDELIQEAIDIQAYDEASWLVGRAVNMARRATDDTATEAYLAKRRLIQGLEKLAAADSRALKTLKVSPTDADANQVHGDYLFVVKEDLPGALVCWQKSKDEAFDSLAELESQLDRSDSQSILELASAWESAGQSNRSIKDSRCLARAVKLYQQALSGMEGVQRRQIEQKIQKIRDSLH